MATPLPNPNKIKVVNSLIKDDNSTAVQISSNFVTVDAHTMMAQIKSPHRMSGAVEVIWLPENSVEFIIFPNGNGDVKISEDPSMSTYDIISSKTKEAIEVSRMTNLYFEGSSGDTLSFRINCV